MSITLASCPLSSEDASRSPTATAQVFFLFASARTRMRKAQCQTGLLNPCAVRSRVANSMHRFAFCQFFGGGCVVRIYGWLSGEWVGGRASKTPGGYRSRAANSVRGSVFFFLLVSNAWRLAGLRASAG